MNFAVVPENLKKLMYLRGYSMQQIACMASMSERTMYKRFERPGDFTLEELSGLSKHLKVTFEQLLTA